jgi:hypothetical protein
MSYTQFTALVNSFAVNVVSWLNNEHSIDATVEDMFKVMSGDASAELPKLPVPVKVAPKTKPVDDAPKTKPVDDAPKTKPVDDSTKVKTLKTKDDTRSNCQAVFTKGEHRGEVCGKTCLSGSKFCAKHRKSKEEQSDAKTENDSETKPKAKAVPKPKEAKPKPEPLFTEPDDEIEDYTLKRIVGNDELFQIKNHNIVIKQIDNYKCEFVGVFDEDPSVLRAPTEKELKQVHKFGFVVKDVPKPSKIVPIVDDEDEATKEINDQNLKPDQHKKKTAPPKMKVPNVLKNDFNVDIPDLDLGDEL